MSDDGRPMLHGAAYVLWLYCWCVLNHPDDCVCVEMSDPIYH